MKTLRLISMAVLAVIMCVNFIACSNDDENDVTASAIEGTWSYDASSDEDLRLGKFTFNSFLSEYCYGLSVGNMSIRFFICIIHPYGEPSFYGLTRFLVGQF